MVSGEAELTSDAIVKYRDAKKKGVTALENMKIAGLEIESDGFSVNSAVDPNAQMAMQRGMPVQPGKQRVQVSERLRIKIKDADKLEPEAMMDALLKVIDTGRDSGLVIGPPPRQNYNYYEQQMPQSMITFKIPTPQPCASRRTSRRLKTHRSALSASPISRASSSARSPPSTTPPPKAAARPTSCTTTAAPCRRTTSTNCPATSSDKFRLT
jgi:hypothetical protein